MQLGHRADTQGDTIADGRPRQDSCKLLMAYTAQTRERPNRLTVMPARCRVSI